MQDLNELGYFVHVVDHRGFAPAARALGVQKSKLSRRIAQLEERLGVRLIQRSTRRFAVTEVGQAYYQHCVAMLVEADAAEAAIDNVRSEPMGVIKLACPPGLLAYRMGTAIAAFLNAYPKVEIQLKAINRPVDMIGEGYDIAIRSGSPPIEASTLVTRKLGEVSHCLVCAPELLQGRSQPAAPTELGFFPSVDFGASLTDTPLDRHEWVLDHDEGGTATVPHRPRLVSDDLSTLHEAALAGIGIAQLPSLMIEADVASGRLVDLLPEWRPRNTPVHAVFPTRRGLLPSIRALIDHLAEECQPYRDGTLAPASGRMASSSPDARAWRP